MAGTKEIRVKIASVKSTQKITKAMEMVAASKMRRAQDRMRAARPYADKIRGVIGHLRVTNPTNHPYLVEREVKAVGLILVSSDRGLCGSLNINVFKSVLALIRDWQAKGVEVRLCLIGAKALQFFRRLKVPIEASITHLGDKPHIADLIGTVKAMLDLYEEKRIDRLLLVSNRFVNTMTQKPTPLQLAVHREHGVPGGGREPRLRDGRAHGRDEERDRQRRQAHRRAPAHLQQGPPGRDHEGNFGDRGRSRSSLVPRFCEYE
jgi:F-type H+-transporting ATPase subunit gamma